MQPHTTTTVEPIDQVSESWLPVIYESPALDISKIPTEALRAELKKRAEAALKKQALHMHIDPLLLLSGKLVNKAAICYGLDPKRVIGDSKKPGYGHCRWAVWEALRLRGHTSPSALAKIFGRDHGTILHAFKKVGALKHTNAKFAACLDLLLS